LEDDANSLKRNLRNLIKNVKLTVNRLHVRFEDDYFSNGESKMWEPFSFGLIVDSVHLQTSDSLWSFQDNSEVF
jgi:hypothetical protein